MLGVFILKRLAFVVVQLFAVIVGTFVLLRLLPVDATARLVGFNPTEEAVRQARQELGIDTSIWDQLMHFLDRLVLHADLGTSWDTQVSLWHEIWQHFPITLQLIVLGFIVALAIAIPAGRAAAARPGGRIDKVILGYGMFAGAQPDFWWGLMFIYVFFFLAGVAPAPLGLISLETTPPPDVTGFILVDALIDGNFAALGNALWHYLLPVCTVAFLMSGPLVKMTRQSLLSVVNADYILYARAAGLPRKTVRWYMLRNALAPVVTLTGALFGFMLGGSVLIETVFSLDGLGVYALGRTVSIDFPAVQAAVIVMTAFSLLVYLLMDILYAVLDPRVRYGGRS